MISGTRTWPRTAKTGHRSLNPGSSSEPRTAIGLEDPYAYEDPDPRYHRLSVTAPGTRGPAARRETLAQACGPLLDYGTAHNFSKARPAEIPSRVSLPRTVAASYEADCAGSLGLAGELALRELRHTY